MNRIVLFFGKRTEIVSIFLSSQQFILLKRRSKQSTDSHKFVKKCVRDNLRKFYFAKSDMDVDLIDLTTFSEGNKV